MRCLYFECREGKKRRFYRIIAQDGLFGPVIVKEWGRIGRRGRTATRACDDDQELESVLRSLEKKRLQRGYTEIPAGRS